MKWWMNQLVIVATVVMLWASQAMLLGAGPASATLAGGGQAKFAVVVAENVTDEIKAQAAELAEYLQKITGARFEVKTGDGSEGIVLGQARDFANLPADQLQLDRLRGTDPATQQSYILRSHEKGVWILGASDLAARYGAWDLLYRAGFRHFFPNPNWEVVPSEPDLQVTIDVYEKPDWFDRRIWYGFGGDGPSKLQWDIRNRSTVHGYKAPEGMRYAVDNAHMYGAVLSTYKEEFAAHPEYRALVDGKRGGQFCLSNPGVQELFKRYAIQYFEKYPERTSISAEPSDGGGWCQCDACTAMGDKPTRAVTIANLIAEVVNERFGEKYVGLLAYNEHALAPAIKIHPRVVVCVATHLSGNVPATQRMDAWRAQGGTMGIYDYLGVYQWHRAMPAKSLGGNLGYLTSSIPDFYQRGGRAYVAESGENWGANGLGYYVASRLLWDVDQAGQVDAIVEDFLDKAFGSAKEPMRRFYQVIDGSQAKPGSAEFYLGRAGLMYEALAQARAATDDPAVLRRIDDLIFYTRYVELTADWLGLAKTNDGSRAEALKAMTVHSYRMRETRMSHYAGYMGLTTGARNYLPEPPADDPEEWMPGREDETQPFTARHAAAMLEAGLKRLGGGADK